MKKLKYYKKYIKTKVNILIKDNYMCHIYLLDNIAFIDSST